MVLRLLSRERAWQKIQKNVHVRVATRRVVYRVKRMRMIMTRVFCVRECEG